MRASAIRDFKAERRKRTKAAGIYNGGEARLSRCVFLGRVSGRRAAGYAGKMRAVHENVRAVRDQTAGKPLISQESRKTGKTSISICSGVLSFLGDRSQQRAAENQERHVEIDDQPGDIDERGDKRRGRGRGVEPESAQQERKHCAADRSPGDDTDEREADCEGDQPMIFPVIENVEVLPKTDS